MTAASVDFQKLTSADDLKRDNSLSTPDFRFVKYAYPRRQLAGPHLSQATIFSMNTTHISDIWDTFPRFR
jgi:hypothetical protein